jgi:hypothetical protein
MSGEFVICIQLPENSRGMSIDCLFPYSRGLIVAGQDGYIWAFEAAGDTEVYRLQQ